MSAIMSQNGQKMAKMLHNAAKKSNWETIRLEEMSNTNAKFSIGWTGVFI